MLNDLLFRARALFRKHRVEAELDEELRFHFEGQCEKYVRAGMTREQAQRRARLEFGALEEVKEDCRDARGVRPLEAFSQDLRYGLRGLWKNPGFTAVALITLALGIGATTAIFSVAYGVLLRPLPFRDADRVMLLNETTPKVGTVSVSYPNFLDWRAQSRTFAAMSTISDVSFAWSDTAEPENLTGEAVSPNFLSLLGVRPVMGRDFDASEENAGATAVVMVSYQLWQSRLGGGPGVIGRSLRLDGRSFSIIGVLPPGFRTTERTDLLEPVGVWLTNNPDARDRGGRHDTSVMARLAPGVSVDQARAEMNGLAARLAAAYPESNEKFGVTMQTIREALVGDLRPALLVLMGAVVFVLLIACANVANLFLMRAAGRGREIALRMAIGASRGRIVCQLLVEGLVLAALGGALGLALAYAGIRGIVSLVSMDRLMGASVDINGAVLLFNGGAVLFSALLFGLSPALEATRRDVQSKLRETSKGASASAAQNWRRGALVVSEVALAVILLAGAGLMLKSLSRLMAVDPGFRTARVLTVDISLRDARYRNRQASLNYWAQLLERVRQLPGVQSAALGTVVPLTSDHRRRDITIEGMDEPPSGTLPHPDCHLATPDYVRTLGVRLIRGRDFTETDRDGAPLVGMINARLAGEYFRNQDPIGKRFLFGAPSPDEAPHWITIVGVVGDTRLYGIDQPSRLEVYTPLAQSRATNMNLVVKSAVDPDVLTGAIRRAGAEIDRGQPIFAAAAMDRLLQQSLGMRGVALVLFALFSGLALALAGIGIYGVISYSVAQRTQEMGIRMALGAQPGEVLALVMAQGGKLAGLGVAIGILAALGLTRAMTQLLFGVSPDDPLTFAALPVALAAVAALACYLPARRTMRVDPMVALRHE